MRGLFDLAHGLDGLADHFAAVLGLALGAVDHFAGLARAGGRLLHIGGQLVEGRGGLFQAGGLVFGAARQVVGGLGDLVGAVADAVGVGGDGRHSLAQGGDGRIEVVLQLAVFRRDPVHLGGQVAGRQAAERIGQGADQLGLGVGGGGLGGGAGLALGLALASIGAGGQAQVDQADLDQGGDGLAGLGRARLAGQDAARPQLRHGGLDQAFQHQGMAGYVPAGISARLIAQLAGLDRIESAIEHAVPMAGLAGLDVLGAAVVAGAATGLRKGAHLGLKIVESPRQRLLQRRLQVAQRRAPLLVEPDEIQTRIEISLVRHASPPARKIPCH